MRNDPETKVRFQCNGIPDFVQVIGSTSTEAQREVSEVSEKAVFRNLFPFVPKSRTGPINK
jgi:hypothetical protein